MPSLIPEHVLTDKVNQPDLKENPYKKSWKFILGITFFIAAIFFAFKAQQSYVSLNLHDEQLKNEKKEELINQTRLAAKVLNELVSGIQQHANDLSRKITNERLDVNNAEHRKILHNMAYDFSKKIAYCSFKNDKNGKALLPSVLCPPTKIDNSLDLVNTHKVSVFGSAIAFGKKGVDGGERQLWSTYYYDNGTKNKGLHVDDYTDTANIGYEWYFDPVNSKTSKWVPPYLDDAGDTYMITYSSLIYDNEHCYSDSKGCEILGVVTADISINELENIIENLISGWDGFGALTYGDGLYLYHPEKEFVKNKKTLSFIAKEKNDTDRLKINTLVQQRQSDVITHISTTTKEKTWLVIEPLKTLGWSLQNTFYVESMYNSSEVNLLRQGEVNFNNFILLFVVFLILFISHCCKWNTFLICVSCIFLSLLLVLAIGKTWDLALNTTKPNNSEDKTVVSLQDIDIKKKIYHSKLKLSNRNSDEILDIPTGLYVQTIELKNANEVNVSGRVWQLFDEKHITVNEGVCSLKKEYKYASGVQFGSSKNVRFEILPEELNESGKCVISWRFQVDVVTKFDYSKYPLEIEYLDIHLMPSSVSNNIFLVPDVSSYKFGSNRKAGLNEDIFIPGWTVFRSYFTLTDPQDSKPTFGMQKNFDKEEFYDFHFKIGLKRVFIDAFISNLTPLIVVAIILFAVALLPNSIDISRVLGICVSVFFVVVFSHLAIRKNIASGEIFYLEYFFFSIYVALLLVPLDTFRETLGIKSRLLEANQGIIYKVLYWPCLLSIFYIATIVKFY